MSKITSRAARLRRHHRIRTQLQGTPEQPRLSVFRSLNHIYVQVIDDSTGNTLVTGSTIIPDIRAKTNGKNKTEQAELVGTFIAKEALDKGITKVVFDRGGYLYHGRVKALAEAARKAGLQF